MTAYDLLIPTTDSNGLPAWNGGPYTTPKVLYSATGLNAFANSGIVNGAVPVPAARRLLLQAGVRYALILVPGGPPAASMMWRGNSGASSYPAGSAYELIGPAWVVPGTGPKDHGFRIHGACE